MGPSPFKIQKMRDLISGGFSVKEVSKKTGMTEQVVRNYTKAERGVGLKKVSQVINTDFIGL